MAHGLPYCLCWTYCHRFHRLEDLDLVRCFQRHWLPIRYASLPFPPPFQAALISELILVYFFIRETRGRSLENMNELFDEKDALDAGSSSSENAGSDKAVETSA
jgi:hypothetical protein